MAIDSADATVVNATNMGDRSTLEDFVRWGTEISHRDHTMLIMWGHGDGTTLWYQILVAGADPFLINSVGFAAMLEGQGHDTNSEQLIAIPHDPSSESSIALSGNPLPLNLDDVKTAIATAMGQNQLDVVVLDACNMGSIEASYELHATARLLVTDERSHEPGVWDYTSLLNSLERAPETMQAAAAAQHAFVDQFQPFLSRRLSIVNLNGIDALGDQISKLAQRLSVSGRNDVVLSGREVAAEQTESGIPADRIDLGHFLKAMRDSVQVPDSVRVQAAITYEALQNANASSSTSPDDFLSVYFPASPDQWHGDTDLDACKNDGQHPLAFVCNTCWYELFRPYFRETRAPLCTRTPLSANHVPVESVLRFTREQCRAGGGS